METKTNEVQVTVEPAQTENPFENGIQHLIRQKYSTLADTDSYKLSHHCQYVPGATRMISYIESRGGEYDEVLFFGLQMIIKEYLMGKLTQVQVDALSTWAENHLMGNIAKDFRIALQTVVNEYDGVLPIKIRAVKEGTVLPVKNVLATIESTVDDSRVFSIVSLIETMLLRVWGPTTVATTSFHIRKVIYKYLTETADDPDAEIAFKLHDFGARGVMPGSAGFAGAGHLAVFKGTDNINAVHTCEFAYDEPMAGYSIPATEHSTTTSRGVDGELGLVAEMFDQFASPGALFATVIDSYDALDFVRTIAPQFKDLLVERGATWVFRPDSGDPVKMPVKIVQELDEVFGHTLNHKGYKVLNNVRVIQGDGIVPAQVTEILQALKELGYSASNIAFGMGGGLLQKCDRDTLKFSMKCCAVKVGDEWFDVFKNPAVYDSKWRKVKQESFKKSKAGRMELMYNTQTDDWLSMPVETADSYTGRATSFGWVRMLDTVFENGQMVRNQTLQEIRKLAGTA